MAKKLDAETVARTVASYGLSALPKQVKTRILQEAMMLLMQWLRKAHRRAKRAEKTLQETPSWKRMYESLMQSCKHMQLMLDNALANNTALEEQLARYAQMNDEMADAYNKKMNELEERVNSLEQIANAAIAHSNAITHQLMAERQVSVTSIKLSLLGVTVKEPT